MASVAYPLSCFFFPYARYYFSAIYAKSYAILLCCWVLPAFSFFICCHALPCWLRYCFISLVYRYYCLLISYAYMLIRYIADAPAHAMAMPWCLFCFDAYYTSPLFLYAPCRGFVAPICFWYAALLISYFALLFFCADFLIFLFFHIRYYYATMFMLFPLPFWFMPARCPCAILCWWFFRFRYIRFQRHFLRLFAIRLLLLPLCHYLPFHADDYFIDVAIISMIIFFRLRDACLCAYFVFTLMPAMLCHYYAHCFFFHYYCALFDLLLGFAYFAITLISHADAWLLIDISILRFSIIARYWLRSHYAAAFHAISPHSPSFWLLFSFFFFPFIIFRFRLSFFFFVATCLIACL